MSFRTDDDMLLKKHKTILVNVEDLKDIQLNT